MTTYTDEELMNLVQKQDIPAFEELYRRYEGRIFVFFWRLGADRQEAEDGTQETFLRLWRARTRYEPTGRFSSYLFQIAKNHFLRDRDKADRRLTSQGSFGTNGTATSTVPPAPDQPDVRLHGREVREAVGRALSRLPEAQRLVYVLTEQEAMSYQQVAEVLDCPVGTVSSRKVQAVKKLRELLQPLRAELLGDGEPWKHEAGECSR